MKSPLSTAQMPPSSSPRSVRVRQRRRYSGLGKIAFALALLGGALLVIPLVASRVLTQQAGGDLHQMDSGKQMVLTFLELCGIVADLLAFLLGLISLFDEERKKTYGILALIMVSAFALIIIGGAILAVTTAQPSH